MQDEDVVRKELLAELEVLRRRIAEFEVQEARTRRWVELVQRVNALKEDLLTHGSLDEKLKRVTDGLVEIFGADFARIWITKPGDRCDSDCVHAKVTEGPHVCRQRNRCLHLMASSGRYTHIDGELHRRVPFDCYKIGRIASGAEPKFLTNDVANDPRIHDQGWARELGLVSFAGYRLLSEDAKPIGVMALFSKCAFSPDEAGMLEGLANTSSQVVQAAMVDEARKESENRYSRLVENTDTGFVELDASGRVVQANDPYARMAGASRADELIGRSVLDWTAPECITENDSAVQLCLKQGHISDFETTYLRADGSRARILINATTEDGPEGRKIVTLCRDITERKKAEEAADRANQEWERTFNAISDLVMVLDDQHKILRANKAMADALGMTEQELIGKLCFELVHGEKEPPVFCPHSQLLTDGEEHSAEVVEPRLGGIYDVRVSPLVGQNGQVIGSVHVTRDITERKLAEERLLLLNFALDHVRDAAYLIDENARFIYVNDEACRALSYNRAELLGGMSVLDIGPGWTEERWTGHWHELKASGSLTFEAFHKAKDGHVFPVEITANIFHYHGADYNVALARDITERKLTERELQRSNDLLRALIEAAPTAIVGLDLDGNVRTVWNPAAEKMLGWSAQEAMGRPLPSVPVESQEEFRRFRERIRSGKTLDGVEVRRQKRDGTPIDYSIYASPLHDAEGRITGNICVLVDITERKQAEEEKERLQAQLLQAQKMEAIGTLAGGIAHDFNNLLQVVLGYSDILLFNKKPSDPDYERLHAIRQAGRHGSELAKRILAFSRRLEPNARPVNLNNEIRRVQKMLERTVPKMIRIEILLADNPMTVNADPGQMEQILLNLAVNAQHAMPDGGRLTIETANVTLDEDYSRTHLDVEPGEYVLLTVSDTGHGMDKEVVEHIFEPFYTTKGPGEGTGLGLSMVFGIVKSHKGNISCYSEPGTGTAFRIYLPAIVQEIEQDVAVTQQMPAFGTETILLVDDEKSIRKLGEQMLNMAGYRVLTATNGIEALEVYRSNQARIALVLLDLMMPEMGGKQCLEELLKTNPRVKVVIASGYSPNGPTKEALTSGAKGFVNKPYDIRQVLAVVRAVLDEEQGRPQVSD